MNDPLRLDLDQEQLGRLYPAHLVLDEGLVIVAAGPAICRRFPKGLVGSLLRDHFSWADNSSVERLALCARQNTPLQLRTTDHAPTLQGSVIQIDHLFLLAMNYIPALPTLEGSGLQMSDFAPSDPMVPALMLAGMQRALLEESRANALELARERQRSDELLERVRRVAGFMAHDFNNLLSILSLNGDRMMKAGGLSEQQQRLVRTGLEIVARGSDITRSLMTLAHQKQDWREPLDVDALLLDSLPMFSTIVGIDVQLEHELRAGGFTVEASRSGLLNCLVNLLINSRDAMPDGGAISIATSTMTTTDTGGTDSTRVLIELRDTGVGMAPDTLERAFDPLFSTKANGSGIGLASVAEFVNEVGGRALIQSEPGGGTVVLIELPACEDLPVASPTTTCEPATVAPHGPVVRRILVVEDEPYALEALCEMLEDEGFRTTGLSCGRKALEVLQADPHDLLLTDVVMPGTDGLEVASTVASVLPQLPIILMSGYVPNSGQMKPEWLFIRKPLDATQLLRVIDAAFRRSGTG